MSERLSDREKEVESEDVSYSRSESPVKRQERESLTTRNIVSPRCLDRDQSFSMNSNVAEWQTRREEARRANGRTDRGTALKPERKDSKNVKCDACRKAFDNVTEYTDHVRTDHAVVFKCTTCRHVAGGKRDLVEHIRVNMCDQHIPCQICSTTCRGKIGWAKHMETTHTRTTFTAREKKDQNRPKLTLAKSDRVIAIKEQPIVAKKDREIVGKSDREIAVEKDQPIVTKERDLATDERLSPQDEDSTDDPGTAVALGSQKAESFRKDGQILPQCTYCRESFPSVEMWRRHIKREHPVNMFFCHKCNAYSCEKVTDLKYHLISVHNVFRSPRHLMRPKCLDCDVYFANIELWRKHRDRLHNQEAKYKCQQCPHFRASRFQDYAQHRNAFHKVVSQERMIRCIGPNCDKTFNSATLYTSHRIEEHSNVYKCHLKCDFTTPNKRELAEHLTKHAAGTPAITGSAAKGAIQRPILPNLSNFARLKVTPFCKDCQHTFEPITLAVENRATFKMDTLVFRCKICQETSKRDEPRRETPPKPNPQLFSHAGQLQFDWRDKLAPHPASLSSGQSGSGVPLSNHFEGMPRSVFRCGQCKYTSDKMEILKIHLETHRRFESREEWKIDEYSSRHVTIINNGAPISPPITRRINAAEMMGDKRASTDSQLATKKLKPWRNEKTRKEWEKDGESGNDRELFDNAVILNPQLSLSAKGEMSPSLLQLDYRMANHILTPYSMADEFITADIRDRDEEADLADSTLARIKIEPMNDD